MLHDPRLKTIVENNCIHFSNDLSGLSFWLSANHLYVDKCLHFFFTADFNIHYFLK